MANEFYDILGVAKTASQDEIKRAYRKKAMELHPDRHKGDKAKEAEFKKVNEAYSTLSDPQKRAAYDRGGGIPGGGFEGFPGGFSADFDFGDIFEQFFGGGFGGAGRGGRRREVGADLEIRLRVSFEKAVRGGTEEIAYDRQAVCPDCHGSGAEKGHDPKTCPDCNGTGRKRQRVQTPFGVMEQMATCPRCHGAGKIVERPCPHCRGERYVTFRVKKTVEVPAGIEDGMTVKMRGEGNEGVDGKGDLYLHFSVPNEERGLRREGADLHYAIDLDPAEMVLGCRKRVEIPVIGAREVEVPAGSQHGRLVRFKGEGTNRLPSGGKGDLIIALRVRIPEKPSSKERDLYGEIAKEKGLGVDGKGKFGGLF